MDKDKLKGFSIRTVRPDDLPRIEALEACIQPYRPEDDAAVQAMFQRAEEARQAHDPRWKGFPVITPRPLEQEFDAFWVAEDGEGHSASIVGIIAVQTFRPGDVIPARHPLVQNWQHTGRVAELRRLRVAPQARGQRLGTHLCQVVLEWSRKRFDILVVNTTTPQEPALQLYRRLGFQEVGISFIDRYELQWMEMAL